MTLAEELLDLSTKLTSTANDLDGFASSLDIVQSVAESFGKAWSGSWLGYHARVYYSDFQPMPPGARFSQEWGFGDRFSNDTTGDWVEYDYESVISLIYDKSGNIDIKKIQKQAALAAELFEESQSAIRSLLARAVASNSKDSFLAELKTAVEKRKILNGNDYIAHWRPKGQIMSRDMIAIEKGFNTPPHLAVEATISAIRHPFLSCRELGKLARRAGSHLSKLSDRKRQDDRVGTNIFIGHGRSRVWKDLKDFVQDRLSLPWDEFNRVPVAGVTNIARLSQMLDDAAFAFLVLTAEDEQKDGTVHARMNVLHEAGLFQGRLGFEKAIVLLEEGCEEFSNIQGLGQIRFPLGNIAAVFEEIRRVLEREELIAESSSE